MERKLNKFFTSTLISALGNLKKDSKAEWGKMTPKKMLKHLIQSSKMIHLENTKLIVKEKNIEKAIAFLHSDKAISRGIEIPKDIGYNFKDGISENIEELKTELINSTRIMLTFLTKNSGFKSIHPFFGELNSEQWLLFQRKHFTHHLSQFDLL
ncbi:MAG: DUF1569 domain-containing protein [Flavobacteriales bacterium]|jgi:hypothetical protein|nr:DUF1569 domain-containing protein [Flavobacteriales bacterium]MBT7480964.1 DUF1569 domain-containing protein [Flavobacteriales bacterium]